MRETPRPPLSRTETRTDRGAGKRIGPRRTATSDLRHRGRLPFSAWRRIGSASDTCAARFPTAHRMMRACVRPSPGEYRKRRRADILDSRDNAYSRPQ
ncbi:hypothetical protein FE789_25565 [Burkholderia pseudomallei]|nr:hypothetical protein FE789_25565 [Burkholderia pseudomallei]